MVLVKVEGLFKKGEARDTDTVGATFTAEDLSPDAEVSELFRKLDFEGEFVARQINRSMMAMLEDHIEDVDC